MSRIFDIAHSGRYYPGEIKISFLGISEGYIMRFGGYSSTVSPAEANDG